jgi:transcriptional regulator with XRE-family HTH domain
VRHTPEFEQLSEVLAANVRRLRLARGLSQEQLAFDADIDRTYVSQIERSVINPSLLVLHKVAVALGTDVVVLLTTTPSIAKND